MKAVLLLSALLVTTPAFAAEDEEEELALLFSRETKVSSVSKSTEAEDVREAAAQVTVITGDEIRAFGFRTLGDVLNGVPESFTGGDRTYAVAGIRGFARAGDYNTRVLLLLDGHAMNEPWNNYAPVGTDFPLDLAQVERIEFIAGPVSALYGTSAFFGAINVVTRSPERATGGVSYASGSAGDDRASVWYGNGLGASDAERDGETRWHLLAYAVARNTQGETLHHEAFAADPATAGTERDTDHDRNGSGYVRMSRGPFSIAATAFSRRRGVTAAPYGSRFGDERTVTSDSHAAVDLSIAALKRKDLSLRVRAYGDVYRYEDAFRYDPDPVFVDLAISQWAGAEAVLEWTKGPSSLVVSVEDSYAVVRQDSYERQGAGTTAPDPTAPLNATPADVRRFNLARGSVQETLRLGARLRLVGGVYLESHQLYGFAAAPRAGVVASPWTGSTIKALYGRGFRTPSIYEAYFDDGDAQTGNGDLRTETVDGAELSVRQQIGKPLEVFVNAFHAQYRDLIVIVDGIDVDPDPVGEDLRQQFQNGDPIAASGVTGGFRLRGPRGATLRGDATGFVFDVEEDDASRPHQGSPEWVAHLVGVLPIERGRASLAGRLSAVGARSGRGEDRLSPYVLADVGVRVNRIWRNVGATASVSNVFDAVYAQPAGDEYEPETLPMPRRRVMLELRWEY